MVHFIQGSMNQDRNASVIAVQIDYLKANNYMVPSDIFWEFDRSKYIKLNSAPCEAIPHT